MSTVDVQISDFSRLLHPFNATLVSCQGKSGPPNLLAIAWIMPVSTSPPILVFAIHPERYSYRLIEETKEFVVNVAPYGLANKVLYCGRRSGKDINKFKATALTPGKARRVSAPIVTECITHIECRVLETIPKGDHVLVIGEVLTAYTRSDAFKEMYDVRRFRPLLHLGGDVFTTTSTETVEPKL
jgi:flavin reductase (DIM6/NTAB) family NADH-FMN oxidoreductase RutF